MRKSNIRQIRDYRSMHFAEFALQHAADCIYWIMPDASFFYVNNAACEMLGYTRDELLTMSIFDIDPMVDRKKWQKNWAQIKTDKYLHIESQHRAKDGRIIDIDIKANYLAFEGGEYDCAIVRDITEHKLIEKALRENESRVHAIFDQAIAGIVQVDVDGRILHVNDQYCRMLGYSREELSQLRMQDITHPDDLPFNMVQFRLLAGGGKDYQIEKRYIRKDGSIIWVINHVNGIRDAMGNVQSLVAVSIDITERRQMEEILRLESAMMANMVEGVHLIRTSDKVIIYTNPQLDKMFGYGPGELLGKHVSILNAPVEKDTEKKKTETGDVLDERGLWSTVLKNIRKDGTTFWSHVSVSHFEHSSYGKVWLSVHEDITERRQAEKLLHNREKELSLITSQFPGLVSRVDKNLRYLFANESYKHWFGISPEAILGRTIPDVIGKDAFGRAEPYVKRALAGEQVTFENPVKTASGAVLYGLITYVPYADKDGKIGGFSIFVTNITERKQAEAALDHSVSLLNATMEATADGILVVDQEGRIVSFNQHFVELWQIPADIIETRDNNQAMAFVLDQLQDPNQFHTKVRELHNQPEAGSFDLLEFRDGRIFERYSQPQRIGNQVVGRVWSFRDITAHKQMEHALKESEEKFYKAFNSSPDSMVINDLKEGRLINVNEAFEKIVGYTRGEAIGKSPIELNIWVHPEERKRYLDILRKYHRLRDFEVAIRRKDGAIRSHKLSAETFVLNGEHCIVSIGVDITDHKIEQLNLQRSLRALRVLSSCSEAVTRITDEQQLLESVCRVAVEQGNYRFAWVGYPQADAVKTVLPMAHAGYEAGYLKNMITWAADDVRGQGPIGRVIRSKEKVVVRNFAKDPTLKPWHKLAQERGYASGLALPLITGDEIIGAFMFYATEADAFDIEEVKLLEELADNLAMGVHTLRIEKSLEEVRQEADRQFRELELIYNTAPTGFAVIDTELRFVRVNKILAAAHNLSIDDHYGRKISDIYPEFAPVLEPILSQSLANGEPVLGLEIHEKLSEGDRYWLAHFIPLKMSGGKIAGINLMLQDITARKHSEELLSLEKHVYELITADQVLRWILDEVCVAIEKLLPGSLCSILLLDSEHKCLRHGAAPGLPEEYVKAIDGIVIGPNVGSCGTAAFHNERVIVADINSNPLWSEYKHLAAAHDLRSCWSTPIRSSKNEVLGTFAIYYHDIRSPASADLDIIDRICHLTGIAIERDISEASLRLQDRALASAVDSIVISDASRGDYPIIYCNAAFERMTGYTRAEVIGKNPRFLQNDDRNQSALKGIRKALQSGKEACVVLRNYRKDGALFWNELHLAPVKDGNDKVTHWIGVHNDITLQKLAEKALTESEDKFAKAFRSLPDPLTISRIVDGTIVDVNDSCLEISGYSRDEVIGKNVFELGVWANPEQRTMLINNLLSHGAIRNVDAKVVKKNGEIANVLISAEIIQIGNVPHMLLLSKDISSLKQAQDALYQNERHLRFLYEENPSMYFTITPDGSIQAVNRFGARELGYTVEELTGQPVFIVFSKDDHATVQQHLHDCLMQPGNIFDWEAVKIRKDGRHMWVKETAVAVTTPESGIVILIVCRDISANKRAEEELQKSRLMLMEAQRVARLGSWEHNLVNNHLTWSDEVFQIFEIDKSKFGASYETFLAMVHPDDRELVNKTYHDSLINKSAFDIVHRLLMPDGRIKYVNEKCETLYDAEDKPLRSLGTVLDVTRNVLTQKELEERANQQNFIAELGKLAIAETELDIIFKTAVTGLANILGVAYTKILQLEPDGNSLLLRSGEGWHTGLIGTARVDADCKSQAGYTLLLKNVVIVKDLRSETRFTAPPLLTDHDIVSGLSVIIPGIEQPFGVLGAHTNVYREFSPNEIDFMQSIAYVLAESINRAQARHFILQSREELRKLTQRLQQVREEERMKISREIHDDLGQRLTALKMDLSWISAHVPKGDKSLPERLDAAISLTDSTLDITRKIALELRPAILDDLGLIPAIEWEAQQFSKRSSCGYTLDLQETQFNLEHDRTITIFRILQEALTNITRHAHASHVDISLKFDNEKVLLMVRDNGMGIKHDGLARKGSLGLMSMRERAGAFGGVVNIVNGKDGGTVVTMELPLDVVQP